MTSVKAYFSRRGFATLLVFCIIVISAILIGMIQSTSYSQAGAGREAIARVRAYWAARAGLEETIARLEYDTQNPNQDDAYQTLNDMTQVATGDLLGASWRIASTDDKNEVLGPSDGHARLNINAPNTDALLNIEPFMGEDIVDAIKDWIDPDDDMNIQGAEIQYYQTLPYGYQPRNDAFRSIAELELVAGVDPQDVRGEDWNLNGILDPNEDDGDLSWPPDNSDGILDRAWSGVLTASSIDGGLGASGTERLDLKTASESDIVAKIQVSTEQAKAITDYIVNTSSPTMGEFLRRNLSTIQQRALGTTTSGGGGGGGGRGAAGPTQQSRVANLTEEQLKLLFNECVIDAPPPGTYIPGKLNINTCSANTLSYLPDMTTELADAILAERQARSGGFTSIVDLLNVQGMTRAQLAALHELLCVRSNVFLVTSRGRDEKTGIEVEIQATLNRSTLPLTITEVLVR